MVTLRVFEGIIFCLRHKITLLNYVRVFRGLPYKNIKSILTVLYHSAIEPALYLTTLIFL